ncbi:MAG: AAA family ATPase [Chloroflexi bacterium]|nr:AAA family ATPase [Chloroflexota bacterium]MBP8059348.1 AAA family ATPase [Chloroflexota bacterium]
MRLSKARVQNYRSIIDTGWFDIENDKTILVGPNEAGKTVLLQALQQINPPQGVTRFDPLRDYPRAKYNDITTKKVSSADITVVEAHFILEPHDVADLPEEFKDCIYVFGRKLDNSCWHRLDGGPQIPTYETLRKDLARLVAHIEPRVSKEQDKEGGVESEKPSSQLANLVRGWVDTTPIIGEQATKTRNWLDLILPLIDDGNATEEKRFDRLREATMVEKRREETLKSLYTRLPIFVLFNNYFRVRPLIHLEHLATRIENNLLDDAQYDYGNQCLLRLLGFSPRELSDLGKVKEPPAGQPDALKTYRDQLDKRSYQLNAASVRLTNEIRNVWFPNPERAEADRLRIVADGQYLKAVVEDELGVEIELDQRSEGFQWLVSFFVVFFAEATDKHENAILLLDEPGLSLHGLKQRDFRLTVSRLAKNNQTLYTTHSPFLVGPDELDLVRVVEMADRKIGTKVHTSITAKDPASILPLQEALGYDLAQSLFSQQRNLVLEGLTDYWYLEAVALLLREANLANLNEKIALIPAASAGKVVYYATILHAQRLKVAALLDSDAAGEQAAQQETLVHTLGNKNILRTTDIYSGTVSKPEIEELLRHTLIQVSNSELGWNVSNTATKQSARPIVEIFMAEVKAFSKYKLAKAFLRWARVHEATDLTGEERKQWTELIERINKVLK